jgi:hypothetical protein
MHRATGTIGSGFANTVLALDTKFREGGPSSDVTPCTFRLAKELDRVVAVEVTSVEMPNCFYAFRDGANTAVSFEVEGAPPSRASIPEGNYCADSLVSAVGKAMEGSGIEVSLGKSTGRVSFSSARRFRLLGSGDSVLANLGVVETGGPMSTGVSGTRVIDPVGDLCVFVRVRVGNVEIEAVEAVTSPSGNSFSAAAKVVLDQARGSVVFQDSSCCISTQAHHMTTPTRASSVSLSVLDRGGRPLVPNSDFSITLTVTCNTDPGAMANCRY